MGTFEQKWGPNGDPKTEKGPHGDSVPQMGTHVATVDGLVWSGHENIIYTGTNAQNLYILALWRTDARAESEDRAILKQYLQFVILYLPTFP